jgi:hypothetical protein
MANPDTRSAVAATMLERITMMREIYGGTRTMRAAAATYLPQHERETDARYQRRLGQSFALNKLKEAVSTASAKPFEQIVTLINADPELELWAKDIDLQGNSLHIFSHRYFDDAVLCSLSHILVDHPTTVNLPNLKVQREAGFRPFFKHIRPENLLAAYTEIVGGQKIVRHARILDRRVSRDDPSDPYKETFWNQVYVIEVEPGATQGVVILYEAKDGSTDWAEISQAPISMDEVPLVTMYAGDMESDFLGIPCFEDLAYKQIEHYQSSSDQRSILGAGRFPMLAASGVNLAAEDDEGEGETFEIGPYKLLYSPEAQGRWYFVEPTGKAIEAGAKDLKELEFQMDFMSLNPVVGTHRQYIPQNEREIAERRVNSIIRDMAVSCKMSLERAIRFVGKWTGKDYSMVEVGMNTDIDITNLRQKELDVLLDAFDKGVVTPEELRSELHERSLLARTSSQTSATGTGTTPAKPKLDPESFPVKGDRPTKQI